MTPRSMAEKWGMKLKPDTISTAQMGAHSDRRSVTGGHPARTRKRQITTERMKLMTWFRVRDEVMLPTLRYAPAIRKLPK